jgi:hypothetical protein
MASGFSAQRQSLFQLVQVRYQEERVPHIGPDFGQMWELAAVNLEILGRVNEPAEGLELDDFPQMPRGERGDR